MENLKDIIYKLELSLINPDTRTSAESLGKLLADDFIEYGSSGSIYNKEITIDSLTTDNIYRYTLYAFEVIQLSDVVVQTRFKTDRVNPDGTNLTSLRSSIWKNIDGNWQMAFHQGTPVRATK
jgi:hypothetical protein